MATSSTQPARPSPVPFGSFLDALPTALYVAVHLVFMAATAWLLAQGTTGAVRAALILYLASQPGFLLYFAGRITMKTAVLVEQTLVFAMVLIGALARGFRLAVQVAAQGADHRP